MAIRPLDFKAVLLAIAISAVFAGCRSSVSNDEGSEMQSQQHFSLQNGCYALFDVGAAPAVLCISGTNEELKSGVGIRVAYVVTTNTTVWCAKTTISRFVGQNYVLKFSPSTKMVSMTFRGGAKEGEIDIQKVSEPLNKMSFADAKDKNGASMFNSKTCHDALGN